MENDRRNRMESNNSDKQTKSDDSIQTARRSTDSLPTRRRQQLETSVSAAVTSLRRDVDSVTRSLRDRLHAARSAVAQLRAELADTAAGLAAHGDRLRRVEATVGEQLAGHLADLDAERQTDEYLAKTIDKLIRYGRNIRLVVYYIDGVSGRHVQCPSHPAAAAAAAEGRTATRLRALSLHGLHQTSESRTGHQVPQQSLQQQRSVVDITGNSLSVSRPVTSPTTRGSRRCDSETSLLSSAAGNTRSLIGRRFPVV